MPSRSNFKKTFGKGKYSKLTISPETGSERLRKLNKGFFYKNKVYSLYVVSVLHIKTSSIRII